MEARQGNNRVDRRSSFFGREDAAALSFFIFFPFAVFLTSLRRVNSMGEEGDKWTGGVRG